MAACGESQLAICIDDDNWWAGGWQHLYRTFDPVNSEESLEDLECTPEQLQRTEIRFLRLLFYVMEKSNFKILSDAEAEVALAGDYLLSLPITIDDSKVKPLPGCMVMVEGGRCRVGADVWEKVVSAG